MPEADTPVSATSAELPADGTVRPMTRWGTPVMHRPNQPVTAYDEELRSLVADMVATMYAADGVGLAACQIGVDAAVFVYDCPDASGTAHRGIGPTCAGQPRKHSGITTNSSRITSPGSFRPSRNSASPQNATAR